MAVPFLTPVWVESLHEAINIAEAGFYFEEGGCWGMALALQDAIGGQLVVRQDFVHAYVLHGAQLFDHQGVSDMNAPNKEVTRDGFNELASLYGVDAEQLQSDHVFAAEVIEIAMKLATENTKESATDWDIQR